MACKNNYDHKQKDRQLPGDRAFPGQAAEGGCNEKYDSYKVTKFACMSLKNKGNRSGIRIIFLVNKSIKNEVNIEFLEIYFKGDKEMNDMELLKNRLKE